MKYGRVKGLNKDISRLVQGCMMLQDQAPEEGMAVLDAVWEVGIRAFDSAHVYGGGGCDRVLGRWIRERGVRDSAVIISKGSHHNSERKRVTPQDMEDDLNESLERMQLPTTDIWMFHRDDPAVPVEPLLEKANQWLEEKRVAVVGCSNWTVSRLQEAQKAAERLGLIPFGASSPNFSLAEQIDSPWGNDCVTISGPSHQADRGWYASVKMPVFTWSSLARGFMSGRITPENFLQVKDKFEEHMIRCYVCEDNWERLRRVMKLAGELEVPVARVALAYVLAQKFDGYTLVASYNETEARDNVAALNISLDAATCAWLDLRGSRS